jgi:signal transduction histidine kinase
MLNNLINDMLDLAKFESGTFKFHDNFFDLIEIVENAFETIRYQAERKNISLNYKVIDQRYKPRDDEDAEESPSQLSRSSSQAMSSVNSQVPGRENVIDESYNYLDDSEAIKKMFQQLLGDKNRYLQILLNFLSNSVHYTKKGGNINVSLVLMEE